MSLAHDLEEVKRAAARGEAHSHAVQRVYQAHRLALQLAEVQAQNRRLRSVAKLWRSLFLVAVVVAVLSPFILRSIGAY